MKRILPMVLLTIACAPSHAGPGAPGHTHDEAPAAATAGGPQRQADGAVFLPKPAQRQLAVRTVPARAETLSRTVELAAEVRPDPQAGGRVQATLPGRLLPAAGGLPVAGQRVRAGQLLAEVEATVGVTDRVNQRARAAELQAQRVQAVRHLERMRGLSDTVPQKEVDAAEAALAAIEGQLRAFSPTGTAREALRAPVSGTVAVAGALAGQVVEPGQVLFEIVDPARLVIEARAYDPALAGQVAGATLRVGDRSLPLVFVGAAGALREQAVPLVFRATGAPAGALAVGQPVQVQVRTRGGVTGMALPARALVKSAANETRVWVKTAPERFEPRAVRTAPLDGARVAVIDGLAEGERVVVQGAALVNQIR